MADADAMACFVEEKIHRTPNSPRRGPYATAPADLYTYHRQTDLAAIPYSSQANGLFQKLAKGTPGQMSLGASSMYDLDKTRQRLERIKHVQSQTGLSITQIVLAYLISQPFPTIPIIGCRTPEQLGDSLQAVGILLTPAQIEYLECGTQTN